MNSDSDPTDPLNRGELDALVAALRNDLPSERDGVRLRTRLSALGLAASEALVTTSAAATATGAASGSALGGATGVAVQASGVSWALKASALAVVSASAIAGPVWYAQERASTPTAAAASAAANTSRDARGGTKSPLPRVQGEALATPPSDDATELAREDTAKRAASAIARSSVSVKATQPGPTGGNPARPAEDVAGDTLVQPVASSTAGFAEGSDAVDSTPAARGPEPTTLREETALIDRALSALRAKDAPRAAALLADHEQRFPNGLLARERERAQRKLEEIQAPQGAR